MEQWALCCPVTSQWKCQMNCCKSGVQEWYMCQGHVFGMIRVWTVFSSHRTSWNLSRKGVFKKKATLKIEY